jgi:Na+-driven multidrug efflux pump
MRQNGGTLTLTSLGLGGAAALFTLMCGFFGIPFAVGSIVCAVLGLKKNKESGDTSTNWAAWIGFLATIAIIIFFVLASTTATY